MSNTFFGSNMSKLDKIRLEEYEAERLIQEKKEQDEVEWAELHGAVQNRETGEWEV